MKAGYPTSGHAITGAGTIRTQNYGGVMDLLDSMASGIRMLDAFAYMMAYTVQSGDDNNHVAYGMAEIVHQQCDDLMFIRDALADHFHRMKPENVAAFWRNEEVAS